MGFSSDGRGLDVATAPRPEERRKPSLKPLTRLAPYIVRYRGRALAALIALIVAALTTLIVPVAVRRMIDFGFQNFITSTMTTMQVSELRMSVSSGPM